VTAGLVAERVVRTVTVPQLSGRPRKFVRATHIGFSAGWLGLVVAMLTLGITAATAADPPLVVTCYAMMDRIVLSVVTPWWLLHHWWVIVKLVVALAVILTGVALTGGWLQQAATQASAAHAGHGSTMAWLLVAASVFHLLFLWAASTISVDKPWERPNEVAERWSTDVVRPPEPDDTDNSPPFSCLASTDAWLQG
jgi:hypothetical protein